MKVILKKDAKKELVKVCLETIEKHDQCSEEYDAAIYALGQYIERMGWLEQLKQLIHGPIWDGDVISKSHRGELLDLGLAVKCCFKGKQGYQTATYRGWEAANIFEEVIENV